MGTRHGGIQVAVPDDPDGSSEKCHLGKTHRAGAHPGGTWWALPWQAAELPATKSVKAKESIRAETRV